MSERLGTRIVSCARAWRVPIFYYRRPSALRLLSRMDHLQRFYVYVCELRRALLTPGVRYRIFIQIDRSLMVNSMDA